MTNAYLHREIREKGGAYGGGASHGLHGSVAFYSYRDPNTFETVTQFKKAVEWAAAGSFDEEVAVN
jgi:Zn-dependent M16 (insulinase) family peptidase